jgi:two-component system, LuxR family, response regulator FixJ
MECGRLLVVDDEPASARYLERIVSRYRPVRHAKSLAEAMTELATHTDWCGFVFDVRLGAQEDGGFQLLDIVTKEYPGVPAAIVTGYIAPPLVNRAAALGAIVVSKPLGEQELLPFLQRVVSREHGFEKDFADGLDAASRAAKLSPREHEILAWFVAGGTREDFLTFSGLAETTLKTHVKHMLAKTQSASMADLVNATLRRVLVGREGEPPALPSSIVRRRPPEKK